MPHAVVYSRRGCHLCELMIEALLPLDGQRLQLEIRDVDQRDDWRGEFGARVPVLFVDDRLVCEFRLDEQALRQALDLAAAGA